VLLDERFRRREQQGLTAVVGQPLGGDEQAYGRLAESRRQTDEGVVATRGVGQPELVASLLEEAVFEHRPLDVLRAVRRCRHLPRSSSFRRIRVRPAG
jgi:hypothetical protein